MGNSTPPVSELEGNIDDLLGVPIIESLLKEFDAQESIAAAHTEVQSARLKLAKKERIPDVNVELLYRRIEASKQEAVDVGIRIPVPLFSKSKQKINAAKADLAASEARREVTRNERAVQEHELRAHLDHAIKESQLIKNELRPRADRVFKAATARFDAGDISISELILARREWLAIQTDYLQSLRQIAAAWSLASGH
jgi:cobalt-zinc-cadmium efflux system outer membrane protein